MNEKLIKIQNELSVPKNQVNKFGGYNYRSCEDILEALKPLLQKEGLLLTISDELVQIGERYYIKATVRLSDNTKVFETTGYAREEETKKGMDGSQITGASSSYARKYALNAMFLIDDTKDSDSTNTHEPSKSYAQTAPKTYPTSEIKCPKCGGEMWDNTKNKFNPKAPDFKCKDKDCGGVIWPPKNEDVPHDAEGNELPVKQQVATGNDDNFDQQFPKHEGIDIEDVQV